MNADPPPRPDDEGWAWFEPRAEVTPPATDVARHARTCLATPAGRRLVAHLRNTFLERRVGPAASEAELRHIEGQRSVVAYLLRLAESDPS